MTQFKEQTKRQCTNCGVIQTEFSTHCFSCGKRFKEYGDSRGRNNL